MANLIIDTVVPKLTDKKQELDDMLDETKGKLDFTQIKDIMKYNAKQIEVSAGVGFVSKALSTQAQDINKATQ